MRTRSRLRGSIVQLCCASSLAGKLMQQQYNFSCILGLTAATSWRARSAPLTPAVLHHWRSPHLVPAGGQRHNRLCGGGALPIESSSCTAGHGRSGVIRPVLAINLSGVVLCPEHCLRRVLHCCRCCGPPFFHVLESHDALQVHLGRISRSLVAVSKRQHATALTAAFRTCTMQITRALL